MHGARDTAWRIYGLEGALGKYGSRTYRSVKARIFRRPAVLFCLPLDSFSL